MENLPVIDTLLPLDLKVKYSSEILFCADSPNLKFSGLKALSQPSRYDSRHMLLRDFCKELSLALLRALQWQIHDLATKSQGVIAKKKFSVVKNKVILLGRDEAADFTQAILKSNFYN